jgi:hypothetical protein
MKPLFDYKLFNDSKSEDKLPCKCYNCDNVFYVMKKAITFLLANKKTKNTIKFCSLKCKNESVTTKQKVNCKNCNKEFQKQQKEIKKFSNHFCSKSCSATYNNTHKTHGIRRSKLEKYLEEQLVRLYPTLHMDFNKKYTINSELDIYIPSLKLAFELNGIFHYEPIHGSEKLTQVQNNDERKFQACAEHNISLCIIDTSKQKYFKESTSKEFLNIITNIINSKNSLVF